MSVSIVLADDQPLLRRGFRMILEAEPDLTVVGEAGNGEEAVDLVRRHRPDVALMDIRMPGTDGIEATQRITAAGPLPKVLVRRLVRVRLREIASQDRSRRRS